MSKQATRKIHLNKVCRSCLSERGHLREIFSTRIPTMMENCASIQVSENDGLPSHICVSCFHQIAKFYTFKKKMERSDRILRKYVSKEKEPSDILNIAVSDAQIEILGEDTSKTPGDVSDDDLPLSERQLRVEEKHRHCFRRFARKSKVQANRIIENAVKMDSDTEDYSSANEDNLAEEQQMLELHPAKTVSNDLNNPIFTDGPPPLVPLIPVKSAATVDALEPCIVRNLPQNTPPLVPIKPLSAINSETIVNVLGDSLHVESDLKFSCSSCSEEFSSVSDLKQHRQLNCQLSGLQCNICRKEFKERKRLIGHLKGHIVAKNYQCKICGKCYPNPSTFRVHMRTHTGERPFKCQICNKGFVRWAGVVGHMKTHNSHKPHVCTTCGKGFKIVSNLERHKVLHSGNLPYCCSYCGKTFSQSDNLQLHVRTYHTHERPYLCNECGKGFVSSTRLNRHMWVHTGYKPYLCKQCPKAYSNSNDLKHHEMTHVGGEGKGEKPHKCSTCDMRFYHPCRLSKHLKTHERPFACTECTKTFSSEAVLAKHVTSKHGPRFFEEIDLPVTVQEVFIHYQ